MTDDTRSQPHRQQRRESFRLNASLRVVLRREQAGAFPGWYEPEDYEQEEESHTLDISETGLSFRTSREYELGERLYARIYLNWPGEKEQPLVFMGEVRHIVTVNPEAHEKRIGLQFQRTDGETRRIVVRFLRLRQQTALRQRKLPMV